MKTTLDIFFFVVHFGDVLGFLLRLLAASGLAC